MMTKISLDNGILKKKLGGETTLQKEYDVVALNEGHLDQIMGLQETVIQNLSQPDLMAPIPLAFMKEHIDRRGFILGVFVDRRLIAYRIVYFPQCQDQTFNMGIDIGLAEDQRSKVANLQMVCVHPIFRGNALASKLNRLALQLLRQQHAWEHVFATVSPYNVWNVRILLDCGFSIAALKLKYGGKLRYIVYQRLTSPIEFGEEEVIYTHLEDLERQKEIFNSGFYGVALTQKQSIDNDFIKNIHLYNYIRFKKPSGRQQVHEVSQQWG